MMPDLGKYAFTVVSAYGASLVLLIGLAVLSLRSARKSAKALAQVETRGG